jgi:hypothetical protein
VRAHSGIPWTPSAVRRLEDTPVTRWRARLRSPSRRAAVSDRLWRQLAELAAVCRHRQAGAPDRLSPAAAETLPPGEEDTVRPADLDLQPPDIL